MRAKSVTPLSSSAGSATLPRTPGATSGRAAHAGLGEVAYRNAYGVVTAVFDATYDVIQSLGGQPPERGQVLVP
jgi:hypothetical protein